MSYANNEEPLVVVAVYGQSGHLPDQTRWLAPVHENELKRKHDLYACSDSSQQVSSVTRVSIGTGRGPRALSLSLSECV